MMMTVTAAALAQLKVLWKRYALELGDAPLETSAKLRIFVKGAGCQGLKYGIELDKSSMQDNDTALQIDNNALPILIDPISLYYLKKATLDFEESLQHSAFVVKNPHVATTCACGTSFGF